MKNTQTEYSSSERMPVILPEMEQLLPPLSAEQFSALEADILQNGCYAPIIVNEDMVIVDGHNRFRICEKHSLPFMMKVFSFANLLDAKQWALDTQKGRRNLDKWELGKIALKLKPEIETRAKANQGTRTDLSVNSPKSLAPVDTRREMAQAVGIGELSTPVRFCSFSPNRQCRKMAGKGVQPLNNYTCRFRPSSLKQADKSGLDGLQAGK